MVSDKCSYFDGCNCPLCPMDEESLLHCYWFPGEVICRLQSVNQVGWIKAQRKIARAVKDNETYFTLSMLQHPSQIKGGITGINPDASDFERQKQEVVWFQKHPKKREMSAEEKVKIRERFENAARKKKALR